MQVLVDQRKESAVAFLEAAVAYFAKLGVRIEPVMTDNGSCYRSKMFRAAGKRLTLPNRCSTAATIRSRTPEMPPVVARKLTASPVTAIEREGNPHPLAIVAADLEAIGAPTPIALIDRNAAVMPPLDSATMAIEQQAMDLHHPVDPLVLGRLQARCQRLALEDGANTPVAVGRSSAGAGCCRSR